MRNAEAELWQAPNPATPTYETGSTIDTTLMAVGGYIPAGILPTNEGEESLLALRLSKLRRLGATRETCLCTHMEVNRLVAQSFFTMPRVACFEAQNASELRGFSLHSSERV